MFWTSVLVVVALDLSRVPAELVNPGVKEQGIFEEASAVSGRGVHGHHPHVALLRGVNPGFIESNCAGSIVHRNWVLTAARCTARRTSVVLRVGVSDFTTVPDYIYETKEWWVHPRFNVSFPSSAQANDISIVKVQRPFTYSNLVRPIRIQPSADAFTEYENQVLVANGLRWTDGDTPEILSWAHFRGISNRECSGTLGWVLIINTSVCTRWFNATSQASCRPIQMNGGSLWHLDSAGDPVLVGINSIWQDNQCNNAARIGVFVRPGAYHGWLTEITGLDFENLNEKDEVTDAPPSTEVTEAPTTTGTEFPSSETPDPQTTEETDSITNETTEAANTEATEPSTAETTEFLPTESTTAEPLEPPTTETTESSTAETTELLPTESTTTEPSKPPTTKTPQPPITVAPEPDREESDEDSNDSDSSESQEDPELSQILNKLLVKLKVKVKVSNDVN